MISTVFLKVFWTAFGSKQAAGVSQERSNGAGEGERSSLSIPVCMQQAANSKVIQLACAQLCFLPAEDPLNEL